jgi:hypothetical protein
MVTKIELVYHAGINKRDHRPTMEGTKKKAEGNFKEILAQQMLNTSPVKVVLK